MKDRNYQLDNAKGLLIILVFYAHFIGNILGRTSLLNNFLWSFINIFHMCAFYIISGYLSANRIDKKQFGKVVSGIFIPYLFAQFGLFLMFGFTKTLDTYFVTQDTNSMSWLRPSGALWYLLAIVIYVFVTSCFHNYSKSKLNVVLFVAIAISLLMGFLDTIWYMRFTKVVCFYPYFLIGYILSRNNFERVLRDGQTKIVGFGLFAVGTALVCALQYITIGKYSFLGIISMEDKGKYIDHVNDVKYWLYGPIGRIALIFVAVTIAMGIILMMPKSKTIISTLGKNSIYIFVLHWYIVRGIQVMKTKGVGLENLKKITTLFNNGYNVVLICLPMIIILCFILQSAPVRKIFRPFLQPKFELRDLIGQ